MKCLLSNPSSSDTTRVKMGIAKKMSRVREAHLPLGSLSKVSLRDIYAAVLKDSIPVCLPASDQSPKLFLKFVFDPKACSNWRVLYFKGSSSLQMVVLLCIVQCSFGEPPVQRGGGEYSRTLKKRGSWNLTPVD